MPQIASEWRLCEKGQIFLKTKCIVSFFLHSYLHRSG